MRFAQRSLDCAPAAAAATPPPCADTHTVPLIHRMPPALLALAVLHLAIGASIGLSVDEAHYLLYAAHPDWSYFDHPPLVGWIQWPLVVLDAPVWLVRALPGALWLLSAWGIVHVAKRLQPAQRDAGLWALAAFALAPVIHVLAIGLVPDTLLMALSIWTMALTQQMVQQTTLAGWRWWLLLGLALGLAGLSKYTAVLLAVPCCVCCCATAQACCCSRGCGRRCYWRSWWSRRCSGGMRSMTGCRSSTRLNMVPEEAGMC